MSENSPELPVRVFLVLQNRLLRDALNRLLRKRADFLVVGLTKPEDCSPQVLADCQCDVFVLDFLDSWWLPKNPALAPGSRLAPKFLLICMDDDSEQFLAAIHGGAAGYLAKEASTSDVVSALRAVSRGEGICSPRLCAALFQKVSQTATIVAAPVFVERPCLTLRQQRLMTLVAGGLTNKEIASQLNLSHFTVRNHVHRIMKQFRVESRSHAVHAILSCGYRLEAIEFHAAR